MTLETRRTHGFAHPAEARTVVYISRSETPSSHFHAGTCPRPSFSPDPLVKQDPGGHGHVQGPGPRAHGDRNQPVACFFRQTPEPGALRPETEDRVPGNVYAPEVFALQDRPVDPESGRLRLLEKPGGVDHPADLDPLESPGRPLRHGVVERGRVPLGQDGRRRPEDRPEVPGIRDLVEEEDAPPALLAPETLLDLVVFALGDARRDAVVRAAREAVQLLLRDEAHRNAGASRELLDRRGARVLAAAL